MTTESDLQKAQRKVSKALDKAESAGDISMLGNTLAKLVLAGHKLEEASYGDAFAASEAPAKLPEPGVPS